MKKAGEPIFVTYIQAIDNYCNEIEYAIKIVDLIKGTKNAALIENRLGNLNQELNNFNIFLSDDYEKYIRRTFIEIEPSKLNETKKEISRTLNELKRKFIGKIYKESLIIFESICLKIETAIETDLEFIKGDVKLKFTATGFDQLFTVEKNGLNRTYQIKEYFELEIKNWLDCIDETDNVSEQIQAANDAILLTANKFFGFTHPKVKELKNDAIEHFKTVLNYLKDSDTIKIPHKQTKTKTEQEQPKTFEELFYDKIMIAPCIDLLKKIEPPLIDTECNYIGNLKGAFCVWIDEMQRQGIVKHFSDRKIFASLLPQKIKRFSINESMFGKHQSKAENQYRTDIKTLLSQIKHSQNSQKGKLGK